MEAKFKLGEEFSLNSSTTALVNRGVGIPFKVAASQLAPVCNQTALF